MKWILYKKWFKKKNNVYKQTCLPTGAESGVLLNRIKCVFFGSSPLPVVKSPAILTVGLIWCFNDKYWFTFYRGIYIYIYIYHAIVRDGTDWAAIFSPSVHRSETLKTQNDLMYFTSFLMQFPPFCIFSP